MTGSQVDGFWLHGGSKPGGGTYFEWEVAPWTAYFYAMAGEGEEVAESVARLPFRSLDNGTVTTLASIAASSEIPSREVAQGFQDLASHGVIRWNHLRQGVESR